MLVNATLPLRSNRELEIVIDALALISLEQMRANRFPDIYSGAVRYKREPAGVEFWQPAIDTYARGSGDCEDLAALLIAHYWLKGVKARAYVKTVNPWLRHVMVRLPDGKLEDPSAKLGMKGKG